MSRTIRRMIVICLALLGCFAGSAGDSLSAAEAKPAWQVEWDKTVKAAEDEGTVVLYVTGAFEPVFREAFQKKYPKIKVTLAVGRGPDLSQRIMSERRVGSKAPSFSGSIPPGSMSSTPSARSSRRGWRVGEWGSDKLS